MIVGLIEKGDKDMETYAKDNYTIELAKINRDQSLVMWVKDDFKEFVVCTDYNEEKPMGSRWCWGHYFWDIVSAVEYAKTLS